LLSDLLVRREKARVGVGRHRHGQRLCQFCRHRRCLLVLLLVVLAFITVTTTTTSIAASCAICELGHGREGDAPVVAEVVELDLGHELGRVVAERLC